VNPRVSLGDAYRYSQLALEASEKYPSVDPLLLLAIGTVESRYDPQAISSANARGLYQIWPSSGRLLFRSLGWDYDDVAIHDPEKNTEAAALYLDILFTAYGDPQMVLAEYNGGPLNAGYFRAGARPGTTFRRCSKCTRASRTSSRRGSTSSRRRCTATPVARARRWPARSRPAPRPPATPSGWSRSPSRRPRAPRASGRPEPARGRQRPSARACLRRRRRTPIQYER